MRRITFILLVFITISFQLYAQDEIIGMWDQSVLVTNKKVIKDLKNNFDLSQSVSYADGVYTGYETKYSPSLDFRGSSFVFEGMFKTNSKASSVMSIAGNRSTLSAYTGWDFVMLNTGELRFLVCANDENPKSITTKGVRFDDSAEHTFSIHFDAEQKKVNIVLDKKYSYTLGVTPNLGSNSGRRFYIGAQPSTNGGKTILFKGTLDKFIFKGTYIPPSLEDMDDNMGSGETGSNLKWTDVSTLTVEGLGWSSNADAYTRLPLKYNSEVSPQIWDASRQTAGITIYFQVKGTTSLNARWSLTSMPQMSNMSLLAMNGLDLYTKINGSWVWTGLGKPEKTGLEQESVVRNGFSADKTYECKLYLPLLSHLSKLEIGTSKNGEVSLLSNSLKPIVFYGSSSVQGRSAIRSGMAYPAQIGRRLNCPTINLGFSDATTIDPCMAPILAEIDASAYVIDCNQDITEFSLEEFKVNLFAMIRNLRCLRPNIPILIIENRGDADLDIYSKSVLDDTQIDLRKAIRATYDRLHDILNDIYYIDASQYCLHDSVSKVDFQALSDIALYDYCEALYPLLCELLNIDPLLPQ